MKKFVFILACLSTIFLSIRVEALSVNVLKETLTKNASWVKECQDNRVYIKSNRLNISENDLYVMDDSNTKIPISEIFCDSQGIYTRIESLGAALETVYGIIWCRNCEGYRTVDISGHCNVCGKIP